MHGGIKGNRGNTNKYRGRENANFRHGLHGTRFYVIWRGIKTRCENPNAMAYKDYGGRGIKVLWPDLPAFHEDMKDGYFDGATIERKDVNGNYCKENCIWIPKKAQGANTRRTLFIEIGGKRRRLKDVANELGINYQTLYNRLFTYKIASERAFLPVGSDLLTETR